VNYSVNYSLNYYSLNDSVTLDIESVYVYVCGLRVRAQLEKHNT